MKVIKLGNIFPVKWSSSKQARVFINDTENFKASAPIGTMYKNTDKNYVFVSNSGNTSITWNSVAEANNKILDAYFKASRKAINSVEDIDIKSVWLSDKVIYKD